MSRYNSLVRSVVLGISLLEQLQANPPLKESSRIAFDHDFGLKPMPKWQAGALVAIDRHPGASVTITVFDKAGQKILDHMFQVPGSTLITVRDFARSADGTIGLIGGATEGGQTYSYIAFLDPISQQTKMVRLSPFTPLRIMPSSDGSFWVAGYEFVPRAPGEKPRASMAEAVKKDASVFRQFDKNGISMNAAVPAVALVDPLFLGDPDSIFANVGNEIVWYAQRGKQLIAFKKDGSFTEVKNLSMPEDMRITGFGVLDNGEIVVSSFGKAAWSVQRLLPTRREWQELAGGLFADKSVRPILLVGADGSMLTSLLGNSLRMHRVSE